MALCSPAWTADDAAGDSDAAATGAAGGVGARVAAAGLVAAVAVPDELLVSLSVRLNLSLLAAG